MNTLMFVGGFMAALIGASLVSLQAEKPAPDNIALGLSMAIIYVGGMMVGMA